jgi:hypothetical protein
MGLEVSGESRVSSTIHTDTTISAVRAESSSAPPFFRAGEDLWHALVEEAEKPAVKTAAEIVVPLALGAVALKKGYSLWFRASNQIKTAFPLRSLVRIGGYGSSEQTALAMEKIIAGARGGIDNGKLQTGADVEQYIAKGYMQKMYPKFGGVFDRGYIEALPRLKNLAYAGKFDKLFASSPEYVATTQIDGRNWNLMKSVKVDYWDPHTRTDYRIKWLFPRSSELKEAVQGRIDKLFGEVMATKTTPHSVESLNETLSRVAEMEWLNANLWKYARGSAGISQLEARTWLEAAGIDSGRYKKMVDPNLEALIRPLDDFRRAYPTFFEEAPNYFRQPVHIPQVIPEIKLRTES